MKNIYIGFGSNNSNFVGGLERVTNSHIFGVGKDYYDLYICLGTDRRSEVGYLELPWKNNSIKGKLLTLFTLCFYSNKYRGSKFYIHGSPILSLFCIFNAKHSIVMHHGDVAAEFLSNYSGKKKPLYFLLKFSDKLQNILYHKHVSYNLDIISKLRNIYHKNPIILANFVERIFNFKNFTKNQENIFPIIISVAYWTKRKNLSYLLEFLFTHNPAYKLILRLVGDVHPDYVQEFNEILTQISYFQNVNIERYINIDDEQLYSLLHTSDYYFHYSVNEGFPRAMQEAQICGCTVVCHKKYFNDQLLAGMALDFDELLMKSPRILPLNSEAKNNNIVHFSSYYIESKYYDTLSKI